MLDTTIHQLSGQAAFTRQSMVPDFEAGPKYKGDCLLNMPQLKGWAGRAFIDRRLVSLTKVLLDWEAHCFNSDEAHVGGDWVTVKRESGLLYVFFSAIYFRTDS